MILIHEKIIGWTLIIIGWAIIIWNSNRIAKRSEVRGICNKIISILEDLQSYINTLTSNQEDPLSAELNIASKITNLEIHNKQIMHVTATSAINNQLLSQLRDINTEQLCESCSPADEHASATELISDCIETTERNYQLIYLQTRFWKNLIRIRTETFAGIACGLGVLYFILDQAYHALH